jgi:hypothetical protein
LKIFCRQNAFCQFEIFTLFVPTLTICCVSEQSDDWGFHFSSGFLLDARYRFKRANFSPVCPQGTYLAVVCMAGVHLLRIVRSVATISAAAKIGATAEAVQALPLLLLSLPQQPNQKKTLVVFLIQTRISKH